MTFTSSFFLLGILPLFVLLYRWGGKKPGVRKALLLVTDVLFLIWGGVGAFLVLLAYIVLAWGWTALDFRAEKNGFLPWRWRRKRPRLWRSNIRLF